MAPGSQPGDTILLNDRVEVFLPKPRPRRTAGPLIDVYVGFGKPLGSNPKSRSRPQSIRPWLWFTILAVIAVSLLLAFRGPLIDAAPPLRGVMATVGLPSAPDAPELGDIHLIRVYSRGWTTLRVEGQIQNATGRKADLPTIELILRSRDGAEIQAWQATALVDTLGPGGVARFTTELDDPPTTAAELLVRLGDAPEKVIEIL